MPDVSSVKIYLSLPKGPTLALGQAAQAPRRGLRRRLRLQPRAQQQQQQLGRGRHRAHPRGVPHGPGLCCRHPDDAAQGADRGGQERHGEGSGKQGEEGRQSREF